MKCLNSIMYRRWTGRLFLGTSDIISVHVPLNNETLNMIDLMELQIMKSGVILLNTLRVGMINESVLLKCFKSGKYPWKLKPGQLRPPYN